MFAWLLEVQKVTGTGSGIPKVTPDMGFLFQALLGNPQPRIVLVLKAGTGRRNSGAREGKGLSDGLVIPQCRTYRSADQACPFPI